METKIIAVEGMSCQHCVNAIQKAVGELKGIHKVNVDLQNKKVTVELDPTVISLETIKETIVDQGYDVP
ncbi:MAG TPA: copper resistance protein CopZ [Firmicutes bacterium]|nr:copper resistance protein CopZ [Bacillota bacterium]